MQFTLLTGSKPSPFSTGIKINIFYDGGRTSLRIDRLHNIIWEAEKHSKALGVKFSALGRRTFGRRPFGRSETLAVINPASSISKHYFNQSNYYLRSHHFH